MSLVGFHARNHRQQVGKRGPRPDVDDRATTPEDFAPLHGGGAELVVMLLPANRTEQGWWQRHVEPHRRAGALTVEFLSGRMRFLKPGQVEIKPNERPPFGCCLVIFATPTDAGKDRAAALQIPGERVA